MLWERARTNAERVALGSAPRPRAVQHGAAGRPASGSRPARCARRGQPTRRRRAPRPPAAPEAATGGPPRPVFVIGADRSGVSALAWALGQHPALRGEPTDAWLAELAALEGSPATSTRPRGRRPSRRAPSASRGGFGGRRRRARRPTARALGRRLAGSTRCAIERARAAVPGGALRPRRARRRLGGRAWSTRRSARPARPAAPRCRRACGRGSSEGEALDRVDRGAAPCLEAERRARRRAACCASTSTSSSRRPEALRACLEFAGEEYARDCMRPLRGLRARDAPSAREAVRGRVRLGQASAPPRVRCRRELIGESAAGAAAHVLASSRQTASDVLGEHVPAGSHRRDRQSRRRRARRSAALGAPATSRPRHDGRWVGYHPRNDA